MSKQIVGSYFSIEEAVKAVNIYELEGHEAKNIIVLTNPENKELLDERTDVAVTDNAPNHKEPSSFTDKIKEMITHQVNFELDTHDKLVDYGLSNEDAKKCLADIQTGKTVVLADDELRMGQS